MAPFLRNVTLHAGPFSSLPHQTRLCRRGARWSAFPSVCAGRAVAVLAEHTQAVAVGAAERNRHDVVDLELYRVMRDPIEAWAYMAIGCDPPLEERLALTPAGAASLPVLHADQAPCVIATASACLPSGQSSNRQPRQTGAKSLSFETSRPGSSSLTANTTPSSQASRYVTGDPATTCRPARISLPYCLLIASSGYGRHALVTSTTAVRECRHGDA